MRIPFELDEMRKAETALTRSIRHVDFSEYEWMENIEEFDQEIIRMIEEEWFYELCFTNPEHYRDGLVVFDDGSCYSEEDLIMLFTNNLYQQVLADDPHLSCSSLNPNAPEFVPKNES